ncbi:MAG: FHA domain-containing protein, partial [Polyangiaceae bacterium]
MTLALGKEQISLGSAPDDDVVIAAPGVAPHHARVVRRGGQLFFVDMGVGPSTANGAPVAPQQSVPFDFRTVFTLGGVPVPLAHAAFAAMLMSAGQVKPPPGQVIVGRDATRASLVIAHAAVSGEHATVMLDRMMVVDHGSTSGTWIAGHKALPNQPTPIDASSVIAFGPVSVPVSALKMLDQIIASGAAGLAPVLGATVGQPAAMSATSGAGPIARGGAHDPSRRHRTVIGELRLDQIQSNVVSIGRTPDNQIVVSHPQVSSKHAQIVKVGDQLLLEDRG